MTAVVASCNLKVCVLQKLLYLTNSLAAHGLDKSAIGGKGILTQ
jgi:hypothetical protein